MIFNIICGNESWSPNEEGKKRERRGGTGIKLTQFVAKVKQISHPKAVHLSTIL